LLVDDHLSAATISLFSCKVSILFGFFDLVHSCSIREVLNLAWWNSFLFLLLLDGLFHADTLLDSKLLEIFLKVADSVNLFECSLIKFILELILVDFEDREVDIYKNKLENELNQATFEEINGVSDFEKNLQKLGIQQGISMEEAIKKQEEKKGIPPG
jgi:hypothetical protein